MTLPFRFLPLLFIAVVSTLHGQTTIKGRILSSDQAPLPGATVMLLHLPDSTLIAQEQSGADGSYLLQIHKNGRYTLHVNALGFANYQSRDLDLNAGQPHHLEYIYLDAETREIAAVSVSGQQPVIRQYVDKLVVNVENSVLAEGNSVLELLEKTPGIVSDGKGNFSIQGRAGANVRIDGRETYLSGAQLANLLRGLQAADVSKLELMSNPSAREDAAGTAGIINIVTKRNKRNGFGGDAFVRGSQTRRSQGTVGGSIHYKVSGLNIYANGSVGREYSADSTRIERQFFSGGQLQTTQRQKETKELSPGKFHSLRTGASYEFQDGGVLDASFHWLRGRFISRALIDMETSTSSGSIRQLANTQNNFDEQFNNLTFNVNYVNKYAGEDHFLKINFDYAPHSNDYDNHFRTDINDIPSSSIRTSARTNVQQLSNTTYAGRLDYSKPFSEQAKLEMGWKATYFFIDNDVRNDTLRADEWLRDANTSNKFQYTQHIQAAYMAYSGKIKRFEYQAGLRGEYTFIKANQLTLADISRQRYFDLFPNGFLLYNINDNHSIRGSFSSRIERPGDHDINAFRIYEDAFTYSEGNPELKPERSYISEIGHTYKNALITTLSMSYGYDVINWIARTGSNAGENLTRPVNIGNYKNYSASVMYNHRFNSWWSANHYVNAFHNRYSGEIEDIVLDSDGSSWSANSRHTLELRWGIRTEIAGYYNSGVTTGAVRTDERYGLDLAAEKKLINERAMLKLAFTGIIRNGNPRYTSSYGDLVIWNAAYPDNRKLMISLSYRFGD
ncbi:outer membrane beta-barrel family protein [Sphingobacterium oryzagri]|uniref:Outer membrane beta-barrel family protein n=1 Tax=Sphingobacterium oryzagri TaxID=3025669 RepID=A0ABY7WN65_9SPHI|nr:outer membrane beta-barrel family protein [Sphingobacterium sp. KACC 22765]WDF69745.1 outer membrane beta-barrel family protein [Sphingobacterium sp. KACC 22765]